MASNVRTVTSVFAQAPASTDSTNIQSDITTLLGRLDTAVTNTKLTSNVRDQLHDSLLAFCELIADNLM